jgi:hypothetical protein
MQRGQLEKRGIMDDDLLDVLRAVGLIPNEDEMADRFIAIAFLLLNCHYTMDALSEEKQDAFCQNVVKSFTSLGVSRPEMKFVLDEVLPQMNKGDEFRWKPPTEEEKDNERERED